MGELLIREGYSRILQYYCCTVRNAVESGCVALHGVRESSQGLNNVIRGSLPLDGPQTTCSYPASPTEDTF